MIKLSLQSSGAGKEGLVSIEANVVDYLVALIS